MSLWFSWICGPKLWLMLRDRQADRLTGALDLLAMGHLFLSSQFQNILTSVHVVLLCLVSEKERREIHLVQHMLYQICLWGGGESRLSKVEVFASGSLIMLW